VPSGENKKRQDAYENEEDKRAERLAKRREKRRKVLEKETPEDRQHRLAKCTAIRLGILLKMETRSERVS
jgi:hypothetical protein